MRTSFASLIIGGLEQWNTDGGFGRINPTSAYRQTIAFQKFRDAKKARRERRNHGRGKNTAQSTVNVKYEKEMLDAYNVLVKQLQERREAELKPEKRIEEKEQKEVVEVAESLSSEGVVQEIGNLKLEIGKRLTHISDRLEEEVSKFKKVQRAIELKEQEVKELYEIERSAETLAALIEAQNQKRREFEAEMVDRKEELNREIQAIREEWEKKGA